MHRDIRRLFHFTTITAFLIGILPIALTQSTPCDLRQEKYGYVCVCTANYCDYLDHMTPENEIEFSIVSSTKAGLRFDTNIGQFGSQEKLYVRDYDEAEKYDLNSISEEKVSYKPTTRRVTLSVNREKQHQKIVGFGGAFTGAVSYLLDKLSTDLQDHLYKSYYSKQGIAYNLLRTPIGGCDFDLAPWAYNEEPIDDVDLTNFDTLDERDVKKIEQIKRLKSVSEVENLRIKAAAWSPPRWMKSNNKWTGFSRLKKEYYQTWADYHIKWLKLWKESDLPIWAISTGNEPLDGLVMMYFVRFMSLGWTAKNQAIWLAEHLGPTIRNSEFKDLIIFGNDDNRYTYPIWFKQMKAARPESIDYLDGLAVHFYVDSMLSASIIDRAHADMPDKIILTTESCVGEKPWQKSAPLLGSWSRAERYMRDFMQDFQHSYNGWIDWNLILDENGGPNYVNNTVDAPVIVNTKNPNEILKQPMFYAIGHFSKFVPEGSIRIDSKRSNVNVDSVAFLRPDNSVALILFNSGKVNVDVTLNDSVRGSSTINIPSHSMNTIIYK